MFGFLRCLLCHRCDEAGAWLHGPAARLQRKDVAVVAAVHRNWLRRSVSCRHSRRRKHAGKASIARLHDCTIGRTDRPDAARCRRHEPARQQKQVLGESQGINRGNDHTRPAPARRKHAYRGRVPARTGCMGLPFTRKGGLAAAPAQGCGCARAACGRLYRMKRTKSNTLRAAARRVIT